MTKKIRNKPFTIWVKQIFVATKENDKKYTPLNSEKATRGDTTPGNGLLHSENRDHVTKERWQRETSEPPYNGMKD